MTRAAIVVLLVLLAGCDSKPGVALSAQCIQTEQDNQLDRHCVPGDVIENMPDFRTILDVQATCYCIGTHGEPFDSCVNCSAEEERRLRLGNGELLDEHCFAVQCPDESPQNQPACLFCVQGVLRRPNG